LHVEGLERIKIHKEIFDIDIEDFFFTNAKDKIKILENKINQIKQFGSNTANNSSTSGMDETTPYNLMKKMEREVRTLNHRLDKFNKDELLESFKESQLRMIEYDLIKPEESANKAVLKLTIGEILTTMRKINRDSSFKFPEPPRLGDYNVLNLFCANFANKNIIPNNMLYHLMTVDDLLVKAEILNLILKDFETKYLSQWKVFSNESSAKTKTEATAQIETLYNTLLKMQEESSSPIKKMTLEKVRKSLETKTYPDEVREMITENLTKFQELNENMSEFQTLKEFLDLISSLPYGVFSEDNFDIENARKTLDDDHFGMEKVKERILEFIAVSKLKGEVKGKALLLVGPPGTGKTSIATSIAKCLGRKFQRISLGGENDVSIVKGHRKTYIGAYPGKIVNALKLTQTSNPVIL
jgi:ATP-dependent Lon protease